MKVESTSKAPVADRVIRIDSHVFRALQGRAEPFVDSPNSVLRKLLGLENTQDESVNDPPRGELWNLIQHGLLKAGDILVWRRPRKGDTFQVTVTAEGSLTHQGQTFTSPSRAANELAGGSNNGWILFRLGSLTLDELRSKAASE